MKITFIGHSSVVIDDNLIEKVYSTIREEAKKDDITICYCGGYGNFDNICAKACYKLKKENLNIEIVFVTPYITLSYQQNLKNIASNEIYDHIIYPPLEKTPPRFAIVKRNEWMILQSDIIIAYVTKSFGGAYKSLQFAQRKQKKIINFAKLPEQENQKQ